jgi:3-deoxy-D-manno-octulosonic-acid transferase
LINGRVSNHSFPRYKLFKFLFKPVLQCFSECLVQTDEGKEKLAILGVVGSQIKVAGQMKYDLTTPDGKAVEAFKKALRIKEDEILFTLGSLREGEEDQLLPLVDQILVLSAQVKILVAPRHLKNAPIFQQKLEACQVKSVLRTELERARGMERVIILDTVGELSLAYALSRGTFVGGTLVPVGGHNIMEPALASVPVCFGPFTDNVKEAASALLNGGGGFRIQQASELPSLFKRFLDQRFFKDAGGKAHQAVVSMKGATEKTVERVLQHWQVN